MQIPILSLESPFLFSGTITGFTLELTIHLQYALKVHRVARAL
jgi:hypothetical protein